MEQTYQVFKALCEPLGLNVLGAHDYAAENTKTANTRDVILSKAHILICTTGRLLNLVFHEEERRKIHPMFLASQNPSPAIYRNSQARAIYLGCVVGSVGRGRSKTKIPLLILPVGSYVTDDEEENEIQVVNGGVYLVSMECETKVALVSL